MLRLARVAYPTWQEDAIQTTARKCFLAGLSDPEVRRTVRLKQPVTLNDALLAASHVESIDELDPPAKRPRVSQVPVSAVSDSACTSALSQPSPVEVDVNRVAATAAAPASRRDAWAATDILRDALRQAGNKSAPQRRSRSRSPRHRHATQETCFNCNKVGHFRRDCPRLRHAKRHNNGRRERSRSRSRRPDYSRPRRAGDARREPAGNDQ